jgi:hypothetical protein
MVFGFLSGVLRHAEYLASKWDCSIRRETIARIVKARVCAKSFVD